MTKETASAAVAHAVREVNQAWIKGEFDVLNALVDPEIVLVTPGFGERVRGSDAYVSGHRDFVENAVIHDFAEHDIDVDVVGDSAVATYRYELDYERSGTRYNSSGRDLYVFRSVAGKWVAAWRTILEIGERVAD